MSCRSSRVRSLGRRGCRRRGSSSRRSSRRSSGLARRQSLGPGLHGDYSRHSRQRYPRGGRRRDGERCREREAVVLSAASDVLAVLAAKAGHGSTVQALVAEAIVYRTAFLATGGRQLCLYFSKPGTVRDRSLEFPYLALAGVEAHGALRTCAPAGHEAGAVRLLARLRVALQPERGRGVLPRSFGRREQPAAQDEKRRGDVHGVRFTEMKGGLQTRGGNVEDQPFPFFNRV